MHSTITTITTIAALAAGAGPVAARLDAPLSSPAANHQTAAAGVNGRQYRHLGGDVVAVAKPNAFSRAPIVRVATPPAADNGFSWGDAGIGAGLAAALLLSAAAASAIRRQHMTPTL
jgi:hypothetical protein